MRRGSQPDSRMTQSWDWLYPAFRPGWLPQKNQLVEYHSHIDAHVYQVRFLRGMGLSKAKVRMPDGRERSVDLFRLKKIHEDE